MRKVPFPDYLAAETDPNEVRRGYPGDANEHRTVGILDVADRKLQWLQSGDPAANQVIGFAWSPNGVLLLDQGFLAGVGNYLRSEILFEARVHPDDRPIDLDPAVRRALGRAVRLISRRAYRQGGVTVAPSVFAAHKRAGEPRRWARFAVFARAGQPCRVCGTPIVKTEKSSRRLYLCPYCQQPQR